jgi:hypothetical protein
MLSTWRAWMRRRARSQPSLEERARAAPRGRTRDPAETNGSTVVGVPPSPVGRQGTPKAGAPTSLSAGPEPPAATVPPAEALSPRPAPAGPVAGTGRSLERKPQPDRAIERSDSAVGSSAAGPAAVGPGDASAAAVGYARVAKRQTADSRELRAQAEVIVHACATRGLVLLRILWDAGPGLERPGLIQALEVIAAGEASCLVVSGLDRLSHSAADLGSLAEWLEKKGTRLIVVDLELDTAAPDGRLAARALAAVGTSTREASEDLPPRPRRKRSNS